MRGVCHWALWGKNPFKTSIFRYGKIRCKKWNFPIQLRDSLVAEKSQNIPYQQQLGIAPRCFYSGPELNATFLVRIFRRGGIPRWTDVNPLLSRVRLNALRHLRFTIYKRSLRGDLCLERGSQRTWVIEGYPRRHTKYVWVGRKIFRVPKIGITQNEVNRWMAKISIEKTNIKNTCLVSAKT